MKPISKKIFEYPVILLKILDGGDILCVDSQTNVTVLDKTTLGMKSGFRGGITHSDYARRVVDFTTNVDYFVSLSQNNEESRLFDIKAKKIVAKVTRHQGGVYCVGVDPLNRYMFSCGEDGKTFAVEIKNAKLAFTLPMHADSINDIAFSDNGVWLATASYDKKVFLFNMDNMSLKYKLIGHSETVVKVQFLNLHRLFSVDRKGNGIIWDMKSGKIITRLKGIHDIVVQVTKSVDNKFLFLATELGYILVYELQNYKMLSANYIKLASHITSLAFDGTNQNLIIATSSNEVYFYNIYDSQDDIKESIEKKNYEKIYKYIERNPLLQYTKIYQKVEIIWDLVLKKAIFALEKGDKKIATALFRTFKNIPSKNKIIQKTIAEYEEFEKFKISAKQGKITLAYSLANKHPMYKDSAIFRGLEKNWKKAFVLAQKYSLDPKARDKVREILIPYRGISEKTKLIKDLFLQGDIYRRFKISIGQKDFRLAFELISQHPFLKEFPEYDSLIKYADTLYIKAQQLLESDDTHSAIKILRVLLDFADFKDDAKNIIDSIELKHKFYEAVKSDDFVSAYNIMSISEELQESKEGVSLQKEWNKDLAKANLYAVDGDIQGVRKVLSRYMNISSKYVHLANVFGWAYMIQLEQSIRQKKEQTVIENGIKKYILCFGIQEQIEVFFKIFKKYYPKTKLNLQLQTKGSMEMWRPSMIVNSILD